MAVIPLPPERFAEAQEELRAMLPGRQTLVTRNVGAVQSIGASGSFAFRGERYAIPPLPYTAGIALQSLALRIQALGSAEATPDALVEMQMVLDDCARIYRRNCQPVSLLGRLTWRFRRNPFRDQTEAEAGALLAPFFACRTRSTVRDLSITEGR